MDSKTIDQQVQENLRLAALWIIEEGYSVQSRQGEEAIQSKLIDSWGVQIWVRPRLDDGRYLALFRIKAKGANYDIHCLKRDSVRNELYEYWMTKVYVQSRADEDRAIFFITKSSGIKERRKIVKESETFIENYPIDREHALALPANDLQTLYDMEAWNFPAPFKASHLDQRRVVINDDGRFEFAR